MIFLVHRQLYFSFYQVAIGLRGIQLFVDAGIPVDTDLVRNLIMEVLQEKVSSMLGYPKPQEEIPAETREVNNALSALMWAENITIVLCFVLMTFTPDGT